ncbi:hypothetical protein ALC56_00163 [Trachymyrmex septentrionalis]|uniref:Uncharacterized protein n=1 Tax=Trachymyrmex septentrionalis TaxID=34720 RepID=A0A195FYD4_9HYME|nr:hypothetical protein ALC56_00163 [Trachymyrmex septentrionalis]
MKRVPHVVFLCTHPKGPKMSQLAAAKYMKKSKSAKNVDDLPERGSICKVDKKRNTHACAFFYALMPFLSIHRPQYKSDV